MDHYSKDTPKYPDPSSNQPGLEVDYSRPQHQDAVENAQKSNDQHGGRKILGLSVGVFWAIVVVCALAIGGGVGGGVGAGLVAKSCDDAVKVEGALTITKTVMSTPTTKTGSSTATRTGTDIATVSPAPYSSCTDSFASVNGTTFTPLATDGNPFALTDGGVQTFRIYCNTNWPGGAFYGNPGVHDIIKLWIPTLKQCAAACAAYNVAYVRKRADGIAVAGGLCRAVAVVLAEGDGCYLKNGTGTNNTMTSGGVPIDSAMLL
ncbi:hypothetical protein B0O99DRAFT_695444 [Bisporella sp. PMI_857]|nr:hypothetical protein B0O99DRAFT_695444 [Bisporella sp. PMI_857]